MMLGLPTGIQGPLSEAAGNKITQHTHLLDLIGSSEACFPPLYHKEAEDWVYFHLNPDLKGIQFRKVETGSI